FEHGARPTPLEFLGVLAEVAQLDVVARADLAVLERPAAGERVDQRGLADAVGADERDVLATFEPQLGLVEQDSVWHLDAPVLELEDDPAGALGLLELELERAAVARVAVDPLDLRQLLHAVLRLARL